MKGILIVLTALLLTVLLAACATPDIVSFTGKVNQVAYSSSDRAFVRYYLEEITFDAEDATCIAEWADVPADADSESVQLNDVVHVQCYCDNWVSVPANSCTLIQDEK